jgi:hypothetical protein
MPAVGRRTFPLDGQVRADCVPPCEQDLAACQVRRWPACRRRCWRRGVAVGGMAPLLHCLSAGFSLRGSVTLATPNHACVVAIEEMDEGTRGMLCCSQCVPLIARRNLSGSRFGQA